MLKFSTFSKNFRGWKYLRKKVEKLSIIVVKEKCHRKTPKWSKTIQFCWKKNFVQKNSKTGREMLKFSTFSKYFRGWKYLRKKVEKLLIIVKKAKCRRKAPKSWYKVQQGFFGLSHKLFHHFRLSRRLFSMKKGV